MKRLLDSSAEREVHKVSAEREVHKATKKKKPNDRISDLPNGVILHILSFLYTKHVVRTSTLSKRWRHLWKAVPVLILNDSIFSTKGNAFLMFVTKTLGLRYNSEALRALDLDCYKITDVVLNKILRYVDSHRTNLRELSILANADGTSIMRTVSRCQFLTSLVLSNQRHGKPILFPNWLDFPSLTSLNLTKFVFSCGESDFADPFLTFTKLKSLSISSCKLVDTQKIRISSVTLVNLVIYKNSFVLIDLSTPRLWSLDFSCSVIFPEVCGCGLSSIKKAVISYYLENSSAMLEHGLVLFSWLQELENLESLKITSIALQILSLVPDLFEAKLSSLFNLKSLEVELIAFHRGPLYQYVESRHAAEASFKPPPVPDGIINFLRQNSMLAKVTFCGRKYGTFMQVEDSSMHTEISKYNTLFAASASCSTTPSTSAGALASVAVSASVAVTYPAPSHQAPYWSLDELPRTVVCTLYQGSTVTSMDFHPSLHSVLAVGCGNGDMSLWEAGLRERLISKPFKIKDISACSVFFQAAIVKDASISVTRVSWSPDGNHLGVAFTKHLIHLYGYHGSNDLRQTLEIDAHTGGVNDLAFSYPNKQLCIVTCGDDKLIKVWDLNGRKLFHFGHEAPVYSVCPHQKENMQFIFSTSLDGKIKAWLYESMGSRVDYDAPGQWCTTMLYSADGSRLFSCGTSKEGDSFLVEWNESEGALKRTYSGFRKKSKGVVQFDTTKNRILAAGEENQIKFWDVDSVNMLTSIDADGGLPSLPRLRFNKEGNLLAVTTADGGVKILADNDGVKYLRSIEARSYEASKPQVETKVPGSSMIANINQHVNKVERVDRSSPAAPLPIPNGVDSVARSDVANKSKTSDLTEIVDPVHCRVVTLPETTDPINKVVRLLYTNSGSGLLALGAKGIQKLWKWIRNDQNPTGKASANVVPQHWQPPSRLLMTNDVPDNSEEPVPCIALSKNDSYVMSACGGKISFFNMMTFEVMATFMAPPPASTFLVFHPQDKNIIAIGMEDASIHFYNVMVDEVKHKLKGHQKRITGLAFSTHLNILVSSSADGQLCFWRIDTWDKKKTLPIQLPSGKAPACDTRVYFHSDQVHLLVCHESQLALYDASKMELIRQWVPQESSTSISSATYSCNSQLVYAAFTDGSIGVFDADSLRLRCHIASSAYQPSSNSQNKYPFVIAAHPQEPNQFAIGMSDGSIKVIEPIGGRWGVSASVDNRTTSPSITNNSNSEQPQR